MWNAFISLWRNIFDYRGRTTVKEYWLAVLMTYISLMIGAFLLGKLVKVLDIGRFIEPLAVLGVYSFIILIPLVAMFVRRMRDTGLSKAIIICVNICMPFFGGIYLACLNSDNTTESRRERFLKLIQPFADIDIRELEDFDCASLCILNKSLLIWFFYDDIKEYTDSKDLKCYSSVGKCYLHELCKSIWVEPEAVPEENIEMWYHHLKSVFEKLDKKTKKAKKLFKIFTWLVVSTFALIFWYMFGTFAYSSINGITMDQAGEITTKFFVFPTFLSALGVFGLIVYLMFINPHWGRKTKEDRI